MATDTYTYTYTARRLAAKWGTTPEIVVNLALTFLADHCDPTDPAGRAGIEESIRRYMIDEKGIPENEVVFEDWPTGDVVKMNERMEALVRAVQR